MGDGRGNFETKEISEFTGILSSIKPQKAEFPETASPFQKNFISQDGVLEARKGRRRLNDTAYDNQISFLVAYTNRNNDNFLILGVRASDDTDTTLDGSLEAEDLDTLL